MFTLSDLFAFMYFMDLPTLRMVVPEACRILAEREHTVSQGSPATSTPENLVMRSY